MDALFLKLMDAHDPGDHVVRSFRTVDRKTAVFVHDTDIIFLYDPEYIEAEKRLRRLLEGVT